MKEDRRLHSESHDPERRTKSNGTPFTRDDFENWHQVYFLNHLDKEDAQDKAYMAMFTKLSETQQLIQDEINSWKSIDRERVSIMRWTARIGLPLLVVLTSLVTWVFLEDHARLNKVETQQIKQQGVDEYLDKSSRERARLNAEKIEDLKKRYK